MFTDPHSKLPARLSSLFAFTVPVLLGIYWPLTGFGFSWVPGVLRAGVLMCVAVLAILWSTAPLTGQERRWAATLGGYLTLLTIPVVFASDTTRAGTNWIRVGFVLAYCLLLARAFRHTPTRRAFGEGSLLVSLLLTAYILGCYFSFVGPVFPTYESTRIFKESVLMSLGVGLNPLAFSCAFSGILAACVLPPSKWLGVTLAMIVGVSTIFTGSRTPLALMIASVLGVVAIELLRGRRTLRWISLGLVGPALLALIAYQTSAGLDTRRWSAITEGRVDLWAVAWEKFLERPLTGYGADSWGDDLVSRMPSHYDSSHELIPNHVGGYHNTYLTLLAEEGAVVFAFALFLLWQGFRTIEESLCSKPSQIWPRRIYLFAFLFLACRGLVEVPGIFGYGQDPAEFGAYALLALIISLPSATPAATRMVGRRTAARTRRVLSQVGYAQ